MALDLLLLNQLQRLNRNSGFNEFFPRRPVCAFYSAANSSYNFTVDFYAEYATVPMRTYNSGSSAWGMIPSIAVAPSTESNQTYYWGGNSSSTTSSSSVSPASGYVGITGHCQTRCLNQVDFNSEQFISFSYGTPANLERSTGVIIGEPGYRQGLNLYKNVESIYISYIGDNNTLNYNVGLQAGDRRFQWNTLVGLNRLSGAGNSGYGDIGYNRQTNTLAFIEGTNDGNFQYRMHIFKGLPKLRASAEHLRLALTAAIAGGSATYETFDFVWSAGPNDFEWHNRTRIIPCDDGTFWLARQGTGNPGLFLARIYFSSGTTRALEGVRNIPCSGTYSATNNAYYGIRHMVSDDGSMVACYHQYYYYLSGAVAVFLPRASAADKTRHNFLSIQDTSYAYSIAPAGGPNFVIGYSGNQDGKTWDGTLTNFDNPASLAQQQITASASAYNISGYPQSTSYGGNGFIKVQDPLMSTTEWRERG